MGIFRGGTLDRRTLNNFGMATMGGTGVALGLNNGAILNNRDGGTFDIQNDGGILAGVGTSEFNNAGTLIRSTSAGLAKVQATQFNNSGTVSVGTGILLITAGSNNVQTGSFSVATGAILDFRGGTHHLQ